MSIYAERLHELANLLDKVPSKQFNINCWANGMSECGFAGCALGWAAIHSPFRAQGLDLETGVPVYRSPDVLGYGFWAAQYFFDIDYGDSRYLFSARFYPDLPGPKDVAVRVREILKQNHPDWTPPPEPTKEAKIDFLSLTRELVKGS